MTTWDSDYFPGGDQFWLEGAVNGNTAFVIAARLFEGFDIERDLKSLRVIYLNPEIFQDSFEVYFRHVPQIKGSAAHTGNLWVSPVFRGQGFGALATRLLHLFALHRWPEAEWVFGLQEKELVYKGLFQDQGYPHCDGQVIWDHNPYARRFDMKVVYGSRAEILASLTS